MRCIHCKAHIYAVEWDDSNSSEITLRCPNCHAILEEEDDRTPEEVIIDDRMDAAIRKMMNGKKLDEDEIEFIDSLVKKRMPGTNWRAMYEADLRQ